VGCIWLLDESKVDERMENPLLVYGALVFPIRQLGLLTNRIGEILSASAAEDQAE
jgi:hypothetical protein